MRIRQQAASDVTSCSRPSLHSLLFGGASGRAHPERGLEAVVDPPLQAGEGPDHEDAGHEALEHQVGHPHLAGDLPDGLALVLGLAHEAHQRVGRVGNDRAKDPCKVSRREGDAELRRLVVRVLGLCEHVRVEALHNLLEKEELGDGVRNYRNGVKV